MPDVSSADLGSLAADGPRSRDVLLALSPRARLTMVVLGFIPLLHLALVAAPIAAAATGRAGWAGGAGLALILLFVAPPIVVRITWRGQAPLVRSDLGGPTFLRWWFGAQWQMIFNRIPWLEECLRMVPGLYSAWLRLWGARIGALVYWSPGVLILDRQWLRIGSRVVFGAGVRINGHAIAPDPSEAEEDDPRPGIRGHRPGALFLGVVTVGDDATIGGYSLLLPGCEVAAGEVTPALRTIHPFAKWERGRHVSTTAEGLAPGSR